MSDIWTGAGPWQGWRLTTDHAASSYGQPVLVDPQGCAYGPGDIISRHLVGTSEAAKILGWSPQKLALYKHRRAKHKSLFPAPVADLAAGPVWLRSQIEEYRARTIRTLEYEGMSGTVSLGTDKMSNSVRADLGLDDSYYSINLNTCEAMRQFPSGAIEARKFSPLELIPVLAKTPARRERYGVKCKAR